MAGGVSASSAGAGGQSTAPPTGQGGSTTPGTAGTAGTAGTGTTAGTGPVSTAECSDTEPFLCTDNETLRFCFEGAYESLSCSEICESGGFEAGPCDDQDNSCDCGEPTNRPCFDGADVFCYCAGCTTADEFFDFYWGCIDEVTPGHAEILPCLANQLMYDEAGNALEPDCEAAAQACLPDEEPEDTSTEGTAGTSGTGTAGMGGASSGG